MAGGEERASLKWTSGSAPQRDSRSLMARLTAAVTSHRWKLRRLGVAASLLIICVSATIFLRTLIRIDLNKFKAAMAATGGGPISPPFAVSAGRYPAPTWLRGV